MSFVDQIEEDVNRDFMECVDDYDFDKKERSFLKKVSKSI